MKRTQKRTCFAISNIIPVVYLLHGSKNCGEKGGNISLMQKRGECVRREDGEWF